MINYLYTLIIFLLISTPQLLIAEINTNFEFGQMTSSDLSNNSENFINLNVKYRPMKNVMFGAGLEKYFSDTSQDLLKSFLLLKSNKFNISKLKNIFSLYIEYSTPLENSIEYSTEVEFGPNIKTSYYINNHVSIFSNIGPYIIKPLIKNAQSTSLLELALGISKGFQNSDMALSWIYELDTINYTDIITSDVGLYFTLTKYFKTFEIVFDFTLKNRTYEDTNLNEEIFDIKFDYVYYLKEKIDLGFSFSSELYENNPNSQVYSLNLSHYF